MSVTLFLTRIAGGESIAFSDTMSTIAEHYHYQPTAFSNGLGVDALINAAGANEGSCKIFAFAKLNGLSPEQTLSLFGDYYHIEVLGDPDGSGHQNIRRFMRDGWDGIRFQGEALTPK